MIRAIGAEKIDVKNLDFLKFELWKKNLKIFFGKLVYSPSMGLGLLDLTLLESQRANLSFFSNANNIEDIVVLPEDSKFDG